MPLDRHVSARLAKGNVRSHAHDASPQTNDDRAILHGPILPAIRHFLFTFMEQKH